MSLQTRFTVQKVSVQFMLHLELFYAVQDNLLCQPVGFFYDERTARIAAEAMEIKVGRPYVLDIERLAEILA
jgi:hypothetical protein